MKVMFVSNLLKNNIFIIYSYATVGTIMSSMVMHLCECSANMRYQTLSLIGNRVIYILIS